MKIFRFKEANSVKSIILKLTNNKMLDSGLKRVFIKKMWSNVMGMPNNELH